MFQSTTIPILEQVVHFAQMRHGVLAGNVANLDTPGYRVQDLSPDRFNAMLNEALEAREERSLPIRYSSIGDRSFGDRSVESLSEVRESLPSILYHDQSDVSIEKQVAEMSKNQGRHNTALTIMISQFRLLESAISERVLT